MWTAFRTYQILVTVCSFCSFWGHLDLVKQVKYGVSGHFLENKWEAWVKIWHADVSWSPSDFCLFNCFVFARFVHADLIGHWGISGAAAIRTLDLLDHIYLLISEEMKKGKFSIRNFSSYQVGGIPDCCVVRFFWFISLRLQIIHVDNTGPVIECLNLKGKLTSDKYVYYHWSGVTSCFCTGSYAAAGAAVGHRFLFRR